MNFRTLSYIEEATLVRPFCFKEIEATVWDCDNFKCPGLDGVNFVIIKEFFIDMKDDILRFGLDYHRNDKILKGINSTFISIILKKIICSI